MAELLLILTSEEIPPAAQENGAAQLATLLANQWQKDQLLNVQLVQKFATPTSIGVCFSNIPARKPARTSQKRGPRQNAPPQAVQGFKKSVANAAINIQQGYYVATLTQPAIAMKTYLANILPSLLQHSAQHIFPKSMRWLENDSFQWIRPLRDILCVFDEKAIPFKLASLTASQRSRKQKITSFHHYKKILAEEKIYLPLEQRVQHIQKQLKNIKASETIALETEEQHDLIKTMAQLSENPTLLRCQLQSSSLSEEKLPAKIVQLIFQKEYCLPLHSAPSDPIQNNGEKGGTSHFLALIDGQKKNYPQIARGFSRVLSARANDAIFFIQQDKKTSINYLKNQLKTFSFHQKLGSLWDKSERVQYLAQQLLANIPTQLNPDHLKHAASYCKADIASQCGKEFPDALGHIGGYLISPNPHDPIRQAITTHTLPLKSGDPLPSPLGQIVSIADRADTLAGFFSINETPTGSKDPFALRRLAIGLIRIILESNAHNFSALHLNYVFTEALALYPNADKNQTLPAILHFIRERLKYHLRHQYPPEQVEAALKNEDNLNLIQILARLTALHHFLKDPRAQSLISAWKRLGGILKNDTKPSAFSKKLCDKPQELTLADKLSMPEYHQALANNNFQQAFLLLATLKPAIDDFFNNIRVEVPNKKIRQNRYALCRQLHNIMQQAANFNALKG